MVKINKQTHKTIRRCKSSPTTIFSKTLHDILLSTGSHQLNHSIDHSSISTNSILYSPYKLEDRCR